jgi:hypothetical protein
MNASPQRGKAIRYRFKRQTSRHQCCQNHMEELPNLTNDRGHRSPHHFSAKGRIMWSNDHVE